MEKKAEIDLVCYAMIHVLLFIINWTRYRSIIAIRKKNPLLEADTSDSTAALAGAGAGAEVDHDVLVEPLVDQDMDNLLEASFLDCTGMKNSMLKSYKNLWTKKS